VSETLQKEKKVYKLVDRLAAASQKQLTGRLDAIGDRGQTWSLYFCVGRLLWATTADHPVRRLQRHLARQFPQVSFDSLTVRETDRFFCWSYQVLWILAKRQKLAKDRVAIVVEEIAVETLFDLLQQESNYGSLTYQFHPQEAFDLLKVQLTVLKIAPIFKRAKQEWLRWSQVGLKQVYPNWVPRIENSEQLQQNLNPRSYKILVNRLDNQLTLRELAAQTNQDPARLGKTLLPYLKQGWIKLSRVADIPRPQKDAPKPPVSQSADRPFIACVDDSPQVCKILDDLLSKAGYRFIAIQDSVQALPILIEKRPDAILLDLVMPVANGYEVCSQLRRLSQFEHTPIVILTSNDRAIDRVRAKLVRATDFVSKPIDEEKLLAVLKKHLSKAATERS